MGELSSTRYASKDPGPKLYSWHLEALICYSDLETCEAMSVKPKVEMCPITGPTPGGEGSSLSPGLFTTRSFPWQPHLLEIPGNWVGLSLPHWSPCFQTPLLLSILHVGARMINSKHNSDSYTPLPKLPPYTTPPNSLHMQKKSPSFLTWQSRPLGSNPDDFYRLTYLLPPLPTHGTLPFLNTLCSLISLNNVLFLLSAWQAPLPLECLEILNPSFWILFKCHTVTKDSVMLFLSHHQWLFAPWCFCNFLLTCILIKSWYFSYYTVMICLYVCPVALAICLSTVRSGTRSYPLCHQGPARAHPGDVDPIPHPR